MMCEAQMEGSEQLSGSQLGTPQGGVLSKAKVTLSKTKYHTFVAALKDKYDASTVEDITSLLQSTFNFDPNASQ